jgi:hypothetical protein
MYRFILVMCLLTGTGCFSAAQAQVLDWAKRTVGRFLADTLAPGQPQFLVYPTLGYAPETSWEIGASTLYLYNARRDTTNRLSEIYGFTFITLERQYGIWFDHALYTHQNNWFFLGRFRFQRFPLLYFGVGPDTPPEYQALVDANYTLLRERVLRKVRGSFFAGLEIDFQQLYNVEFERTIDYQEPGLPLGGTGSANLGLGIGLVYDNRHNVLNVRDGLFTEAALIRYDPRWGSRFAFNTFVLDSRIFRTVRPNQVIAAQVYGAFTSGDVPFNQLALLGGESLMRGYYLGRFRDRNYLASQVEYRWLPFPFSRRFGGVLFMSAGGVAPRVNEFNLPDFRLAGGGGIRFLLFRQKDIFTRLDVAFTREGSGFYFFIGEAF